jgi:hypothetical protein
MLKNTTRLMVWAMAKATWVIEASASFWPLIDAISSVR